MMHTNQQDLSFSHSDISSSESWRPPAGTGAHAPLPWQRVLILASGTKAWPRQMPCDVIAG